MLFCHFLDYHTAKPVIKPAVTTAKPVKKPAVISEYSWYPTNLTNQQMVNMDHKCCAKRCLSLCTVQEIRELQERWMEDCAVAGYRDTMQNMLLIRTLHNHRNPLTRKFTLAISGRQICRNAFGMVYRISRTRLYRRLYEARDGMYLNTKMSLKW